MTTKTLKANNNGNTSVDSLVKILPDLAQMFVAKHPYLGFFVVVIVAFVVVSFVFAPVVAYMSRQQTQRHKNTLEYKKEIARLKVEYKRNDGENPIQALGSSEGGS